MNRLQLNLIITWVLGPTAFLLALHPLIGEGQNWVFILFICYGICHYLRRDLPKNKLTIFDNMSNIIKLVTLIYYSIIAIFIFYIALYHPEEIQYSNYARLVFFLFLVTLPAIPSILIDEKGLYKWAAKKGA